jgi:hypothetical protein
MRFNDFVNVTLIHIGVPNALWIHHGHGAARTTVQTPRLVHPNLAGAGQAQILDSGFAMVKRCLGVVLGAASLVVFSLVEAKKDVALEIGVGIF